MPSRIIRDYTDSLKFDGISADTERLFIRLIMKVDDYGRYHADPRLIRGGCFPLFSSLRDTDIAAWLTDLGHRQLVLIYEAGGRKYVSIANFRQRLKRSVPKFPPPDGKPSDWLYEPEKEPTSQNSVGDDTKQALPGTSRNFPELPAGGGDGGASRIGGEKASDDAAPPELRSACLAAFGQWSEVSRRHGLRTENNEHTPIFNLIGVVMQEPPIVRGSEAIPRQNLIPQAADFLKQKGVDFKHAPWACGCVRKELEDWARKGVPGAKPGTANAPRREVKTTTYTS